ncbi:MAG: zinc ribbon domain-containing protein [Thermoplasmata archaeon]|nr:zinc ribbon domain-containing protein [Thermoplasmata archaeon]
MAIDVLLGNITLQIDPFFWVWGWLVCVVIWYVVLIMIAIWVYRDAESRGMSGALWLLIVLLANIVGLIVYLVVRTDRPQYGYYPRQQPYQQYQYQQPPPTQPPPAAAPPPAQPQPDVRFCSNCGASLPPGASHCPNCGTKVQ